MFLCESKLRFLVEALCTLYLDRLHCAQVELDEAQGLPSLVHLSVANKSLKFPTLENLWLQRRGGSQVFLC